MHEAEPLWDSSPLRLENRTFGPPPFMLGCVLELFSRTIVPDSALPQEVWERLNPFHLLDSADPLLWWREGNWMVGRGRLLTLQFSGSDRFSDAASTWADLSSHVTSAVSASVQHVSESSNVIAQARVRAFSSFAFADESPTSSVIIVPELLVGHKDGQFWATRVWAAEDKAVEAHELELQVKTLAAAEIAPLPDPGIVLTASPQIREDHERAVAQALDLISRNQLSKVVLARTASAPAGEAFDARSVLANLARTYPTCWVYAVDGFFGASPETLVEVHSGHLHTRVLAGTQPRTSGDQIPVVSLMTDAKERNEHEFAVRSVVDVLDECATGSTVDGPKVLELPNVWHLATDITATLREADLLDVVGKLHPTAAVAGVPRTAALDAISALEIEDRGRYAGPVGWLDSSDDGEWAVGIRSAQLRGDTVTAWAGGGIVEGSVPADEFEETEAKLAPIRDALAE